MHPAMDKKYFYLREHQQCYYCGKALKLSQVTLDHYLPRSHGGTSDAFNLVCACKRCNQFKASKVPQDTGTVHLDLLMKQAQSGHMGCSVPKLSLKTALTWLLETESLVYTEDATIACGKFGKLWLKDDRIFRYEAKGARKFMDLILLMVFSALLAGAPSYAQATEKPTSSPGPERPLISLTAPYDYSADNINAAMVLLADRYPEWTHLEKIGTSVDNRPIYNLILTAPKNHERLPRGQFTKTHLNHYLFEAGLHAREVANPISLLYVMEQYLLDTQNTQTLPTINTPALLENSVFHVVALSNPDGYNLAKYGLKGLKTPAVRDNFMALGLVNDPKLKTYPNLKANARGVDLNRNFEDIYYNPDTKTWTSIWNIQQNSYFSPKPSSAFYAGPQPNSEPETQALSRLILTVPFSAVLSFHSKGEVIYWRYWMQDGVANQRNLSLAQPLADITGYRLMAGDSEDASSGYMGDFVANFLQRPLITIETTNYLSHYHKNTPKHYQDIVKVILPLPARLVAWGQGQSPPLHWLYQEALYLRSYHSSALAHAIAARFGGSVWSPGAPPLELGAALSKMDRPPHPPLRLGPWISWSELVESLRATAPDLGPWQLPSQNSANPVRLKDLRPYLTARFPLALQDPSLANNPSFTEDGVYMSHYGVIPLVLHLKALTD